MKFLRDFLLIVLLATLMIQVVSSELSKKELRNDSYTDSGPSPTLKPLTPIAGTNLVLNTPYKWHDRTKSGCYTICFWNWYKTWSENRPDLMLLCSNYDEHLYETEDAEWIFERTDGSNSMEPYDGKLIVRTANNHTIKIWESDGRRWVGMRAYYWTHESLDTWKVRSDPSNKNHLQIESDNSFLAQMSVLNHRSVFYLQQGDTAGFPYSFVPVIDLEAKMYNFVFVRPLDEELAKHTSQKGLIDSYTIRNDSPGSVSRTISVSETITDEFSFGFSESLRVCVKVSGSANIPFIVKTEFETSFDIGFSANQQWKSAVQKQFQMTYDISVPARTEVTISASYDLIKGISMDYTARTEITGKTMRITVFNDKVADSPATGEVIRNYLDHLDFDGKIIEVRENSVIAEIKGTMVASVGVRGKLSVNGNNVYMADAPKP